MSIIKFVAPDKEAIKNMPSDLLSELIVLNDVIPQHLQTLIRNNNMAFHKGRKNFFHGLRRDDPILREIGRRRMELKDDYDNRFQIEYEYDLEFLEKYPQFKSLFKCINHLDAETNKVVGSEPLP